MIKKHFKKLVSLALTAVMVMGMSTTTFAKESNNISNDTVTKTNYNLLPRISRCLYCNRNITCT